MSLITQAVDKMFDPNYVYKDNQYPPVAKQTQEDQQKIIDFYLNPSITDKVTHIYHSNVLMEAGKDPNLQKGALIGGLVGGVAGFISTSTDKEGKEVSLSTRVTRSIIGAFLGVVGGATVATAVSKQTRLHLSNHFNTWICTNCARDVFPMFLDFVDNDEEIIDLLCTINLAYMTLPSYIGNDGPYEYTAIKHWIKQKQEENQQNQASFEDVGYNNTSPKHIGDRFYTIQDIEIKKEVFGDGIRKLQEIRTRVVKGKTPPEIVEQGLKALYDSLGENYETFHQACVQEINARFKNKHISKEELIQGQAKLTECYAKAFDN